MAVRVIDPKEYMSPGTFYTTGTRHYDTLVEAVYHSKKYDRPVKIFKVLFQRGECPTTARRITVDSADIKSVEKVLGDGSVEFIKDIF